MSTPVLAFQLLTMLPYSTLLVLTKASTSSPLRKLPPVRETVAWDRLALSGSVSVRLASTCTGRPLPLL